MSQGFSDSIEGNIDVLRELIEALPPSQRPIAKRAAALVEKTVMAIRKDTQGNVAAGIGMTYAMCVIVKRLLESDDEGERGGLIQLLS